MMTGTLWVAMACALITVLSTITNFVPSITPATTRATMKVLNSAMKSHHAVEAGRKTIATWLKMNSSIAGVIEEIEATTDKYDD